MSKYVATIGKVLAICQNDGQNIGEFFFFSSFCFLQQSCMTLFTINVT